MFQDLTQQTMDLLSKIPTSPSSLSKTTIAQSLGLNAFDLRGPALNLYPVLTPLRNKLPRELSSEGDTATRWKAVTGVNTTSVNGPFATAGVSEGRRGAEIAVTEQDFLATYAGLGLEASINMESVWAGGNVFDNKAQLSKALLNSVMIAEETVLLGGNSSLALGTPAAPVITLLTNQGSLTAQVTAVWCVALTLEGLRLATGNINGLGLQPVLSTTTVKGPVTRTNIDLTTTAFGGGSSALSPSSNTVTTTASNAGVSATVTAVRGAAGYAWFVGNAAGTANLAAITTVNAVTILANGASTQVANSITSDQSQNNTEFDGFITLAEKPASNGFYQSLNNAPLTADGANGVVEIDAALQSFWDNARLSPGEIWVHSQEARNINKKVMNAGSSSMIRFTNQMGEEPFIMGGASVAKYWNKFTNQWIDLNIHPAMPAGKILFKTNEIPYPLSEVGPVQLVRCRRDYYQIEWPLVSRQYVYGIYTDEVLVHRAPFSLGVITNIQNG
jgi:hypothetical protein